MDIKIARRFYQSIRERFNTLAKNWNGINGVIRMGGSSPLWPGNKQGDTVAGSKGDKIAMYQKVPNSIKNVKYVDYTGTNLTNNYINTGIYEETKNVHTIGNENSIRESVSSLNNVSYNNIGKQEGLAKPSISNIGTKKSSGTVSNAVQQTNNEYVKSITEGDLKKFTDGDVSNYPYKTSKIDVAGHNVLTYDRGMDIELNPNEVVKYSDYEAIDGVLNKIQQCLSKRDNWFDSSGRCQLSCQVNCQHTCQLSCQGCNRKQCHNQKCGTH